MYEEDFLCNVTPPSCRPDSTNPFTGEYWDMIFDEVMEGVYNETFESAKRFVLPSMSGYAVRLIG